MFPRWDGQRHSDGDDRADKGTLDVPCEGEAAVKLLIILDPHSAICFYFE